MKQGLLTALLLSNLFGTITFAAEQIEVPKDELARESVLPVFEKSVSVKNRNVNYDGSFDLGIFGGLALTEPIANTNKIGLEVNYHFNDLHSIGGFFTVNSTGLSRDARGLKNDYGLNFDRAPAPKNTMMLDYQYSPFYGKLSITKNGVMNTTIYGSLAGGAVKYDHKTYPALSVGIGERFYFNEWFSLKLDLKIFAHQAPIPFKANALKDSDPVPSYNSFDERLTYTTNLQVGMNFLF